MADRLSIDEYKALTANRKKRVKHEEPEHKKFLRWFKNEHPMVFIHHSPNGESRDKDKLTALLKGKNLKEMGVMPGFYDFFIPQFFLFIEMKPKEGGYLSKAQKVFRDEMERIGYKTFKANGCEEAIQKLQEYLKGDIPCLK